MRYHAVLSYRILLNKTRNIVDDHKNISVSGEISCDWIRYKTLRYNRISYLRDNRSEWDSPKIRLDILSHRFVWKIAPCETAFLLTSLYLSHTFHVQVDTSEKSICPTIPCCIVSFVIAWVDCQDIYVFDDDGWVKRSLCRIHILVRGNDNITIPI